MGFSSVVLVGHDDGGLLCLKAAQKVQSVGSFSVSFLGFFCQLITILYLDEFMRPIAVGPKMRD